MFLQIAFVQHCYPKTLKYCTKLRLSIYILHLDHCQCVQSSTTIQLYVSVICKLYNKENFIPIAKINVLNPLHPSSFY